MKKSTSTGPPRMTRWGVAGLAAVTAAGLIALGAPASAAEHHDLGLPTRDGGVVVTWLAGGVVPTLQPAGGPVVSAPTTGRTAPPGGPGVLGSGPPSADGPSSPRASDDLIANNGCVQKSASEFLPSGQNCIDAATLYRSGKVHVHTQVPTRIRVQINDEPAIPGSAVGEVPPQWHGLDDEDLSQPGVYDFWTKPFELTQGATYFIAARANDSAGNLSWRYGEVRVPYRRATVVFDRIQVHSDGDQDSPGVTNRGEIAFDFFVNGTKYAHRAEHKIASGDWVELGPSSGGTDGIPVTLVAPPRLTELRVFGVEDDPGACVVEAFSAGGSGGGCDYASASGTIDLDEVFTGQPTTPGPQNTFVLATGDHHLRFDVHGHWETEWV